MAQGFAPARARSHGVIDFFEEGLRTIREQDENRFSRRQFLLASALAGGAFVLSTPVRAQNLMQMPMPAATPTPSVKTGPADVSLRIGPVLVDVTKDKTISTIGYNGQVPGPLIRLERAGKSRYKSLMTPTPPSLSIGMVNSFLRRSMAPAKRKHCGAASWASQLSIHS